MLSRLKSILRERGHVLYTRPYELNIVGLRTGDVIANRFIDQVHVFYRTSSTKWNHHVYNATTDPGTFWLNNPMQPEGTAILAQGQYVDAYELGLHKGEYEALVQRKPVTIYRDYDRTAYLDMLNGKAETGFFGIDIHRALSEGKTFYVDEFSAGCQVFQDADDFMEFLGLCKQHSQLYGNSFSYTLIDFRVMRREVLRRMALGGLFFSLALLTWYKID